MIHIALIDDHPLAINGIGAWLSGTGRFTISGTAKNLQEASSLFEKIDLMPEIVILDVSLGTEDGLDFIPMLKEICAKKKVSLPGILICSMYEDPFLIQRAVDSGTKAYVPKTAEPAEILAAIEALLKGGTYINPKYEINTPQKAWSVLTRREKEIVSMIKQNYNTRQIAKRLGISLRTVENHLAHIYIKTGANSREGLFSL